MTHPENSHTHLPSPNQTAPGITEIRVAGFKSIAAPQSIEIRPLTILAGANSSGKSSVIQPLLLLKQTLEAPYDPGPLLLDGPNVKFTSGSQLLSRISGKLGADRLEIGVNPASETGVTVGLSYKNDTGFVVEQNLFWLDGQEKRLRADMKAEEARDLFGLPSSADVVIGGDRCFLRVEAKGANTSSAIAPGYRVAPLVSRLIHVPAQRGSRERIDPKSSIGLAFSGTFDNYVAGLVDRWRSANVWQLLSKLNLQLQKVGIAREVRSRPVGETGIELLVDRVPVKSDAPSDFVNIADVGSGVRTGLPVIVALLVAEPGQAVYLEEPENHLHPRAQVQLAAEVLGVAAQRGVRVIAETHSSLLIRAIQTAVARGELDPGLVKLHWFSRKDDGATEIRSADLDADGAFGEWPMDFGEVELKSEADYLDAVEARSK